MVFYLFYLHFVTILILFIFCFDMFSDYGDNCFKMISHPDKDCRHSCPTCTIHRRRKRRVGGAEAPPPIIGEGGGGATYPLVPQ